MKKLLLIIWLLYPLHALALACDTTGAIAEKGDSLEQVLEACGEPLVTKSYETTVNKVERWTYYPSVANTTARSKITLLMRDSKIENIGVENSDLSSNCYVPAQPGNPTLLIPSQCNNQGNYNSMAFCQTNFTVGDSAQAVINACGEPMTREIVQQEKIQVVEMQYGTITPNIWVFQNNKLSDFK